MTTACTPTHLNLAFTALADPTRRAILRQLSEGEARVTELARPFPMSLNGVSKHLKVLERAGLVTREVRGREHWLHLKPEPLREAAAWLTHYQAFWDTRLEALEKFLVPRSRR